MKRPGRDHLIESTGYIGAEVGSNNTAELSGFAAALRWLLIEGGDDAAVIRADSTYAGNLASGVWKAKANRELVANVPGPLGGSCSVTNLVVVARESASRAPLERTC